MARFRSTFEPLAPGHLPRHFCRGLIEDMFELWKASGTDIFRGTFAAASSRETFCSKTYRTFVDRCEGALVQESTGGACG
jgi:hypothetical protein